MAPAVTPSGEPIDGELELIGPAPGQKPPAPMSTQRKARKQALDVLFEAELTSVRIRDRLEKPQSDEETALRPLAQQILQAYNAHPGEIDEAIGAHLAQGWSLTRMPRVDRCLARIAVAEMWFVDTPVAVAITEAVALAEVYSTDESPAFLNGVLGRIAAGERPGSQSADAEPPA